MQRLFYCKCKKSFPTQKRLTLHIANQPLCRATYMHDLQATLSNPQPITSTNEMDVDLVPVPLEPQDLGDVDQEMSGLDDMTITVDNTQPILEMDQDGSDASDFDYSYRSATPSSLTESGQESEDEPISDAEEAEIQRIIDNTRPSESAGVAEEPLKNDVFLETFPEDRRAGYIHERGRSSFFFTYYQRLKASDGNLFHPFANEADWQLARWLILSDLSKSLIDSFLKLKYVSLFASFIRICSLI
jgi:hypothetical protein